MHYARPVARLIEELSRLPGIGPKTAQRLAFHLVAAPPEAAANLAQAILEAREKLGRCSVCANITDEDPCALCRDPGRDRRLICVVEQPRDLVALEKAHGYRGLYHVLHGSLSPMDGVGPQNLTIDRLLARVREGGVDEVIVATNANLEGEATALYLAKVLRPLGVRVTRLAYGLPVGADLEYADGRTLARAIEGRRDV
ncbi:MAG: recombination mediator RecR [Thermoanaerobacterales bacterium]|nr:recombination mediator RecR [Bacillota bacterium]MDI6906992.1 recombination mediator RecR [Thermoanaerobacterales bacterium]